MGKDIIFQDIMFMMFLLPQISKLHSLLTIHTAGKKVGMSKFVEDKVFQKFGLNINLTSFMYLGIKNKEVILKNLAYQLYR